MTFKPLKWFIKTLECKSVAFGHSTMWDVCQTMPISMLEGLRESEFAFKGIFAVAMYLMENDLYMLQNPPTEKFIVEIVEKHDQIVGLCIKQKMGEVIVEGNPSLCKNQKWVTKQDNMFEIPTIIVRAL